jgi:hypothetical protein
MMSWIKYGRLCKRCNEERTCRHWTDVLCTTCTAVEEIEARFEEHLKTALDIDELPGVTQVFIRAVTYQILEIDQAIKKLTEELML